MQVSSFLLRWLYINNLIRDREEIQTLPYFQQSPHSPYTSPTHEIYDSPPHSTTSSSSSSDSEPGVVLNPFLQHSANPVNDASHHSPNPPPHYHHSNHHPQYYAKDPNEEWKAKALHTIALYPPGMARLLALDSLRFEIIDEFAKTLLDADQIIHTWNTGPRDMISSSLPSSTGSNSNTHVGKTNVHLYASSSTTLSTPFHMERDDEIHKEEDDPSGNYGKEELMDDIYCEEDGYDPYLDADLEIIRAFERDTFDTPGNYSSVIANISSSEDLLQLRMRMNHIDTSQDNNPAMVIISARSNRHLPNGWLPFHSTTNMDTRGHWVRNSERKSHKNTEDEVRIDANHVQGKFARHLDSKNVDKARAIITEIRDYLPQFVSAVLHSPPVLPHPPSFPYLDPVQVLRRLLIHRCLVDPNVGIKLCWLLEAEVGRAWKTLFEHRQQTGRRLIVVLPADKAIVLAKIGIEKRSAFDLLQDIESATAYGVYEDDAYDEDDSRNTHHNHNVDFDSNASKVLDSANPLKYDPLSTIRGLLLHVPRLPSSLSMRRCRHFGDTMHFIDRLTKVSLDLRLIPHLQRNLILRQTLAELNRRLRRRMITRGVVSLDMEDGREPHDWPTLEDLTLDVLKYSVHLPLEPKAIVWPGNNDSDHTMNNVSAVRVLNIVTNECRLLASRERCPFLVVCEVVDTDLDVNDVRLYTVGAEDIGVTLQEMLGTLSRPRSANDNELPTERFPPYIIPPELMPEVKVSKEKLDLVFGARKLNGQADELSSSVPRGGWQNNGDDWFQPDGFSPFDAMRQQQLEELHQQLAFHSENQGHYVSSSSNDNSTPEKEKIRSIYTSKSALLDRVYGVPWSMKCELIRTNSPFGHLHGWRLASFILKAGEDIRREALVMQVISKLKYWFDLEIAPQNRPFLRPYTIMCVGGDAGLLECVKDAKSIDEVKKETDGFISLRDYFERAYGSPSINVYDRDGNGHVGSNNPFHRSERGATVTFETAQNNFLRSLVGYSLVCYILQIKDRHNANILLDRDGYLMHIDFGFVLGDTPKMGKVPLFSERAPFKLTAEFWEVIGGWNFNQGGLGVKFCRMFEEAFACASSHADEIANMIEAALLNLVRNPNEAKYLADEVKHRLRMKGPRNSVQQKSFIMYLVNTALTSWGTSTYDWLQRSMNGYI